MRHHTNHTPLPNKWAHAETLQRVDVPYLSDTECKAIYNQGQISPGMMCAGEPAGGKDRWAAMCVCGGVGPWLVGWLRGCVGG